MIGQDQEIFNILLETVSEAVVIVDENQNIMEINGVAETVFGYNKLDIKNKHLEKYVKNLRSSHFNCYRAIFLIQFKIVHYHMLHRHMLLSE